MPECPGCGQENPDAARFCLNCGRTLAGPPAALGEERKVVTVVFCDLVGFTARSDQADPEDVQATLRPFHARLKREIERYGGTVEKFIGDAVVAVFGAPVAHEDDAERGVRAALAIQEAITELNREHPDLELAARSAVTTGEAVVALGVRPETGEGFVAGDVVNTASRLQQVAPVGGVLVGEMTHRITRDLFEYEELEAVRVKGKARPIGVWRALAPRGRFGGDVEREPAAPFIGRDHELVLLKETYARSAQDPSVQLVTVVGEPGVGKTRLVSEFHSYLEGLADEVHWRQGRSLPYGEGVTFWALGEIVKGEAGILESDSPEEATAKLAATVASVAGEASDAEWMKTRLAPLVGAQAEAAAGTAEREEYFAAWLRFFEGLASQRPLVLALEDLHWADPALLDFTEHLADWVTDVPLLILCTGRPELYERRPGWGGGKRNSTTISLGPLTSEQTAHLISALLSETVLPAETQAGLLEHAGGNPLYAEEFVRMLTDRGILERRGRAVRLATDAPIPVPESVQAIIAARLDTLDPDRKSRLHDAAVVGRVFWSGAVASMGGVDERAARADLHELVRKELVRPIRTSSVEDQAEYSFWHLLVRDVAYGQIPRATRAAKHRAAAGWIEAIAQDRVSDHAEILAHHYVQALELARTAGASDEDLEGSARRFLVLAGDRAMQLNIGQAETSFRRALELVPSGHPDRATVLAKAAGAAFFAGRFAESERDYEEAIAELRAQGNPLGVADAMLGLSFLHAFRGKTAQARVLLAEAVPLLERERPGPELARAYAHVARDHMLSGRSRETVEWADKALRLAETMGIGSVAVQARQFRGIGRCELGDLGGLDDLRAALQESLDLGLAQETVRAHINLADFVWETEGPKRGLEVQRAGIEFGERRGITAPVLWTKAETLWTLFDLGEWDELRAAADALIEWDRAHEGSYFGVMAMSYEALVALSRGEASRADSLEHEFLPRAREIGDPQVLAPALAISASIERTRGHLPRAVRRIEELEDATRDRPLFARARFLPDALRICVAAGATSLAETLLANCDGAVAARDRHSVTSGRAILAESRGQWEEARKLYGEASERWRDFGFVLETGQSALGVGRCLLALGRESEASALLREARKVFARLGARPLLTEADGHLERATA